MKLENTSKYKYLGMIINNKGNLKDHIEQTKGKVEAAIQTVMVLAGNQEFNSIKVEIIWKIIKACIIPIIMYGAETWAPTGG